jgi:hypothetical protein
VPKKVLVESFEEKKFKLKKTGSFLVVGDFNLGQLSSSNLIGDIASSQQLPGKEDSQFQVPVSTIICSPDPSSSLTPSHASSNLLIKEPSTVVSALCASSSSAFFSTASSSAISLDEAKIKFSEWKEKKYEQPVAVQNELVWACENGNLWQVIESLKKGAKVYSPTELDKNPVYCAVYAMNSELLKYLIMQLLDDKDAPVISWQDCEEHNKKYYGRIFLNMKFAPNDWVEWDGLLKEIQQNEFLVQYHLAQVKKVWGEENLVCSNFHALKEYVSLKAVTALVRGKDWRQLTAAHAWTEMRYESYRNQIKQEIETIFCELCCLP